MKVLRVDEKLKIYSKPQMIEVLSQKATENDSSLKLLACVDLFELNELKSRFDLKDDRFLLIYVFHSLSNGHRSYCGTPLKKGQTFFSASDYWSGAECFERDISEKYGIKFYLHDRVTYDYLDFAKAPFQMDYDVCHEVSIKENDFAQKQQGAHHFELNDFHPLGQRVKFKLHENRSNITASDILLSDSIYLDKFLRKKKLKDVVHYLGVVSSRYCFVYENLWRETFESIHNVSTDLYQKSVRMLFSELTYGINSLEILRDSFYVCGELNFTNAFNQMIYKINSSLEESKMYRGQKFLINYEQAYPLKSLWKSRLTSLLKDMTEELIDLSESISKINRLKDFDFGDQDINPVKIGLSGASLREFGIKYDIRDCDSFYLYQDLERDRPLGVKGSFYDRLLVKIEDSIQSFSDAIRIVESLPLKEGPEVIDIKETDTEDDRIFFSYTESVLGEISYLSTIKSHTSEIYDICINSPSQQLVEAFKKVKRPHDYNMIALDWVSMGICHEELSR